MKQLCTYLLSLVVVLLSFCACRTAGSIASYDWPERTITDTVQVYHDRVDSVFIHDSIQIAFKGDTIIKEKFHIKTQIRYVQHDSIHIKTDSIPYPVEVEKVVYRTPSHMKIFAYIGITMIISFVILVIIKLRC